MNIRKPHLISEMQSIANSVALQVRAPGQDPVGSVAMRINAPTAVLLFGTTDAFGVRKAIEPIIASREAAMKWLLKWATEWQLRGKNEPQPATQADCFDLAKVFLLVWEDLNGKPHKNRLKILGRVVKEEIAKYSTIETPFAQSPIKSNGPDLDRIRREYKGA